MYNVPTPAALWHVIPLTPLTSESLVDQYGAAIDDVTQDAFRDGVSMPLSVLKEAILESNYVGLLIIHGQLVGFMLAYVPAVTIKGRSFIWLNKVLIRTDYQGHHYGSPRTLADAFRLHFPLLVFGYIGARTQSPGLLKSFFNLSPLNYPFTKRYTNDSGFNLLLYGFVHIPQLRNAYNPDDTFITDVGMFIGVYRRKLGLGQPENGSAEVEALLLEQDFRRDRGDALVVMATL